MEILNFIYQSDAPTRLDLFLDSVCEDMSRSFIQKLIKNKTVSVNGKVINKSSYKLKENDDIQFEIPPLKELGVEPVDLALEVIYEDENILIINKSSGLIVHPGSGTGNTPTLVHGLLYIAKDLSGIGGEKRPGIVHRLDKGTSGLLLTCKNDKAHIHFSECFKERKIEKHYLTLVYGEPDEKSNTIETEIGRHPSNRIKMISGGLSARNAVTDYKLLKTNKYFSLLDVWPRTGRTHQIRVHLSEHKMPILGDPHYFDKNISNNIWEKISAENNKLLKVKNNLDRIMLHAHRLRFLDQNGKKMSFEAPIPNNFQELIDIIG